MKNKKLIITLSLAVIFCIGLMVGFTGENTASKNTGILTLKVNPEIEICYDKTGIVTGLEAENDEAAAILKGYKNYIGKDVNVVIEELVKKINAAGYFKPDANGNVKQITIEVDEGSYLPNNNFLSTITEGLQKYVAVNNVSAPIVVNGSSNYGWSNYGDTDYGPDNDGLTDYDSNSNYGNTSYDSNTNYDSNSNYDSNTNYDSNSNYDKNSPYDAPESNTNYDSNSNYDNNSPYETPDSDTNYDSNSNYDDQNSPYDDNNSNYDN